MADWDGQGLPPAAAARMRRFQADGVRTSLLDAAGAASLAAVGLRPVGEVMGCMVQHVGMAGWGGCGYYGGWGTRTVTSGQSSLYAGYRPYVDALYRGYTTAVARLLAEATAMGGDGVVGVRIGASHLGQGNREFVALGTAVRAGGQAAAPRPFVTDLAGADVATLLRGGWVPVSVVFGISVAIRHDDYLTARQASSWGNTEVSGYSQLVGHVRADARDRFQSHATSAGAEGAIVSSMSLRVWPLEVSDGHRDHVAESTVWGTALASFRRTSPAAPSHPLTVLPLRRG